MSTFAKNRPLGLLDAQGQLSQESFLDEAFMGDYVGGPNLIYKGFARPGASVNEAVWQIAKLTYDGGNNVLSITWPLNSRGIATNDYQYVWANRASYTYV